MVSLLQRSYAWITPIRRCFLTVWECFPPSSQVVQRQAMLSACFLFRPTQVRN